MKVNDYVRTENGIDKVAGYRREPEYENGHVVWFKKSDSGCRFTDKDLPKSSPNIIDLIEVGDYVNGYLVTTENQGVGSIYIAEIDGLGLKKKLYEKDIKSIVTKEMFANAEYRVETN